MVKIMSEELFVKQTFINSKNYCKISNLGTDTCKSEQTDQMINMRLFRINFRMNGPLISILKLISFQDSSFLTEQLQKEHNRNETNLGTHILD